MQNLWLIIVVFFLIMLIIPFFCKIHFSYDLLNNLGAISLYVFFIKIFAFKYKFKGKDIILISRKNRKEIETTLSKKQVRFFEQLTIQLKQKIVIRKLDVYSRIGVEDAMGSALLSGLFTSLTSIILAYIKNVKRSAIVGIKSEPDYNGKSLIFSIYGSIKITIFDIIYSIIMSLTIIKRSEKYERVQ